MNGRMPYKAFVTGLPKSIKGKEEIVEKIA